MKKKLVKTVVIVLIGIIALQLVWSLTDCAVYCAGGKTGEISFVDSLRLRSLLVMKETQFYEYACGFSPAYSIKIGGFTYCLAQDDCNTVYILELDFYYTIFEQNHVQLHELLSKYV